MLAGGVKPLTATDEDEHPVKDVEDTMEAF